MTDLLSQAKTTVAELLGHASPEERLPLVALAADAEGVQLQAFGDSTIDQTNDAEVERFCEQVAERTGGEFVLLVDEVMVVPQSGPVEHVILAHYSGGAGIAAASARVNREQGKAPTLSRWEDAPGDAPSRG